jgi:MFS family permease
MLIDAEEDWTLKEAMTTRSFWAMITAGAVPAMVLTGVSFHQVSILSANGLPASLSSSIFAMESVVSLPIAFITGWVVDRYAVKYSLAAAQGALLIALAMLLVADSTVLALVYALFRGVATGIWSVAADVAWTSYFGKRYLGSIRGASFAVGTVAAAIGPLPPGLIYDRSGSYTAVIVLFLVFPAVAMLFALTMVVPKKTAGTAVT